MYIVAVALLFALFHAVNNYLMICIDCFVALTIWVELYVSVSVSVSVFNECVTDQPTNQPTNRPTNQGTQPIIEMRGRILKCFITAHTIHSKMNENAIF